MTAEKTKTNQKNQRILNRTGLVAGGLILGATLTGGAYIAGAIAGGQEQVSLDRENAASALKTGDIKLARQLDERAARTDAWLDSFPAPVTEAVEFVADLPGDSAPQIALTGLVVMVGSGYRVAMQNHGRSHAQGAHV